MAAVNCRTCLHSTPVEGGWHCARHDRMRDYGQQLNGCRDHLFIPDLVDGEVIDATENFVVYRMKDGTDWVNVVRGEEESE